ncbi:Glycosyl transferase, group 1 domain protein [Rhodopirellula maiorica SM1]|uniref:Glycosyl transferase, group 1 domain protein n=1 Tax=Rhodopirellula maiorica SM1 TaxID=1265738 RepID=M5RQ31_9BACT|nr:glycosyltransferase family 4 protein [Rhodopirellula maiorica]EMI16074.1 Glycosyl transferase, group 1 domain protein [Rhodopirellula maiorica SM1]
MLDVLCNTNHVSNAESTHEQPLLANRLLVVYENHPLESTTVRAVPRLLAQLAVHFASTARATEVITISPGNSRLKDVRSVSATLGYTGRLNCRVRGSRLARSLGFRQSIDATTGYQRIKQALMPFEQTADERTVLVVSTMTAAIVAKQVLPRARVIYWIQGMPRLGQESLASRAVAAADAIVAPSKAIYEDLFALICRDRFSAPVWTIPNWSNQSQVKTLSAAVVDETRQRIGLTADDFAIMHVGRAPEKGLQVAKTALAIGQFQKNTVLVTIGGAKKERRRLSDRAEFLQLGWLSLEELNSVYQTCQLGLVPSVWWENCPLALIEMMSLGICPIGSRVGGIPEMIEHGKNGIIVDAPNDVTAWASAIETLAGDDALRNQLGHQASLSVQQNFNQLQLLTRWRQVLNTAVSTAS